GLRRFVLGARVRGHGALRTGPAHRDARDEDADRADEPEGEHRPAVPSAPHRDAHGPGIDACRHPRTSCAPASALAMRFGAVRRHASTSSSLSWAGSTRSRATVTQPKRPTYAERANV